MGRVARALLVVVALLGLTRPALAWCGGSDAENWREFYSLWGADLSRGERRPVLFVLGAPWCPYCAELLKTYQSKPWAFDIRFVPMDASSDLHRDQLADLVVDGGTASIVRVFDQRRADVTKVAPVVHSRINDIQKSARSGIVNRFTPGPQIASPTIFFLSRQGVIRFTGMPNLAQVEKLIIADPEPVSRRASRRFITSGVPGGKPIDGKPFAKRDNVRLRLLPQANGFSVACLTARMHFPLRTELVEVDGERWLALKGIFQGEPESTAYGRASDFDGWRVQ